MGKRRKLGGGRPEKDENFDDDSPQSDRSFIRLKQTDSASRARFNGPHHEPHRPA